MHKTTTNNDLIESKKPLLMGILNITPDSFTDGGQYFKLEDAINHAQKLIDAGVDILDIGGESTRPGATFVSEEEEIKRVIPVIKKINKLKQQSVYRIPYTVSRTSFQAFLISIDTYKFRVAKKALEAGADIINDVSGLTKDPDMIKIASEANCKVIIMHNKGIPATKPEVRSKEAHTSVIEEVYNWLEKQTNFAIENGIKRENIIIDPGIGFGKTPEEDLFLIENLQELKSLGFSILIGSSKKSFIKKLFGDCDIEKKNQELTQLAINNGADILRIHQIA